MKKYTKKAIQNTLDVLNIPSDNFFSVLKEEKKKLKAIKEKEEIEANSVKKIYKDHIFPELPESYEIDEFLEECVEENDYHDTFYEYEGMDDGGADDVVYFKVADKIYEVKLHCEAEWVGDWSVRKNLPGKVSITSIKEIENFEILTNDEDFIVFKINS
jgi:hypothetical protein